MQTNNTRCVLLASIVFGCFAAVPPSASGQSVPQWAVGDSWKVGTWHGQVFRRPAFADAPASQGAYNPRGRMITVTFEVTGVQKVGETDCYEVQVTFPKEDTGFQRHYRIYYSTQTGRLVRISDLSIKPDGTTKDVTTDYPAASQGPTLIADVPSLVPLDWPDFIQPDATASTGGVVTASQTTVHGTVRLASGAVVQQDEVTLTGTPGKKQAKCVQQWQPPDPWWREAKAYRGGELVSESILLEVNGRMIASPPQ